jgi:hypothetical protein
VDALTPALKTLVLMHALIALSPSFWVIDPMLRMMLHPDKTG